MHDCTHIALLSVTLQTLDHLDPKNILAHKRQKRPVNLCEDTDSGDDTETSESEDE